MSTKPKSLADLEDYYEAHGGRSLGVVGNTSHTQGYHLGRDRIYDGSGPGIGDADYSVKLPRDELGLTDAASAIDFGRIDDSLAKLRKFSVWMVDRCLADEEYRRAFREIIYSPDGEFVMRYSRPDNRIIPSLRKKPDGTIVIINPGNGDASHFLHTHSSFMRDTRTWDLVALIRPYFEEVDMGIAVKLTATSDANPFDAFGTAKLKSGALQRVRDGASVALGAGADLGVVQLGTRVIDAVAIVAFNHLNELHIAPKVAVTFSAIAPPVPPPLPDDTPYGEADLEAAKADGHVAGVIAGRDAEQERIAVAEADRIRAL